MIPPRCPFLEKIMKHMPLVILMSACCVLASASVHAVQAEGTQAPTSKTSAVQTMYYDVYAGGIHAVKAKLDVNYGNKDRYDLKLGAQTIGFLEKLVPWRGTFETRGWKLGKEGDRPELHRSTATWRGEDELKEYSYGRDGSFKGLKVIEAGEDKSPTDLTDDLVSQSTDVLTGTLEVMKHVQNTGKCEGASEVFDGKRRFEMTFKHEMDEVLNPTDYNVYSGETARCVVEVKPMTGEWHSKPRGWMSIQEQGRQQGSLPTVWFAKVSDDMPAVPVKIRVKTEYGTLFMHLTEYTNGHKVIKAAAREE